MKTLFLLVLKYTTTIMQRMSVITLWKKRKFSEKTTSLYHPHTALCCILWAVTQHKTANRAGRDILLTSNFTFVGSRLHSYCTFRLNRKLFLSGLMYISHLAFLLWKAYFIFSKQCNICLFYLTDFILKTLTKVMWIFKTTCFVRWIFYPKSYNVLWLVANSNIWLVRQVTTWFMFHRLKLWQTTELL